MRVFYPSFAQGKPIERLGRKTKGANARWNFPTIRNDRAMPARLPEDESA